MNRLKTFILTGLILIAVYQMFELWFDDYSSRNFFYNVITNMGERKNLNINYRYTIEPKNIVISFGNKQYTVVKSAESDNEKIQNELKRILSRTVVNNVSITEEKIKMKEFLNNKAIMYEYPIKITNLASINNEFIDNSKIAKQIGEFNKIIIQLSPLNGEPSNCFFVDEENDIMRKLKVTYNSKQLGDTILKLERQAHTHKYNATEYDINKKYFTSVKFLPVVRIADVYLNQNVELANPFIYKGKLDEKKVEAYANNFFENPEAKWNFKKQDGAIIYADGEKTVKYRDTGIIEYVNSKTNLSDNHLSFDDTYQIAMAFMEKDGKYNYNNLYLAKVEKLKGGQWKLEFGFKIDNYKYIISEGDPKKVIVQYPVEIIVKNDYVYSYKKLIRSIELIPSFEPIKLREYAEVLDTVLNNKGQAGKIEIKDMFLAYYSENLFSNPKLVWMMETNDNIYVVDAVVDSNE